MFSEQKVIESNVVSSFKFYLLIQLTSCYRSYTSMVMLLYVTSVFSNFLPTLCTFFLFWKKKINNIILSKKKKRINNNNMFHAEGHDERGLI